MAKTHKVKVPPRYEALCRTGLEATSPNEAATAARLASEIESKYEFEVTRPPWPGRVILWAIKQSYWLSLPELQREFFLRGWPAARLQALMAPQEAEEVPEEEVETRRAGEILGATIQGVTGGGLNEGSGHTAFDTAFDDFFRKPPKQGWDEEEYGGGNKPREAEDDLFEEVALPEEPGDTGGITLSDEQRQALNIVLERIGKRLDSEISGPAGTGKTTLMRTLVRRLARPVFLMTPTNQARKRLSTVTGRTVTTIHSAIYPKPEELPDGRLAFPDARLTEEMSEARGAVFIVDEASMVGVKTANDLRRLARTVGAVIVWVGDHAQLLPVGEPPGVDLANATVTLTEVFRQKAGSNILDFVTKVRQTEFVPGRKTPYQLANEAGVPTLNATTTQIAELLYRYRVVEPKVAGDRENRDAFVICWRNDTRRAINQGFRAFCRAERPIEPGEFLVSCSNHRETGVMNGDRFLVTEVNYIPAPEWLGGVLGSWMAAFKIQGSNEVFYTTEAVLSAEKRTFMEALGIARKAAEMTFAGAPEVLATLRKDLYHVLLVDYAYAMTAHRFQGQQCDTVIAAWDQNYAWRNPAQEDKFVESRRWLYTAATRAQHRLVFATVSNK